MSHTYAILQISPAAYQEIRAKLVAADYGHAFHDDGDGEVIDMHGIAVQVEEQDIPLVKHHLSVYVDEIHSNLCGAAYRASGPERIGPSDLTALEYVKAQEQVSPDIADLWEICPRCVGIFSEVKKVLA